MTSNTLYIIAGSIEEYMDWVAISNLKYPTQNFYYVTSPDDFKYTYNPNGLCIGTWYKRKDVWEILKFLVEVCPDPVKQNNISELLQLYLQRRN